MYLPDHPSAEPAERYVSTGSPPVAGVVGELLDRARSLCRDTADGELSRVYPVLAEADPAQFGLALVGVDGSTRRTGDADARATLAVSPGKGALGVFAPLLHSDGNSVRGQLAARFLAAELGRDLFSSVPVRTSAGRA